MENPVMHAGMSGAIALVGIELAINDSPHSGDGWQLWLVDVYAMVSNGTDLKRSPS